MDVHLTAVAFGLAVVCVGLLSTSRAVRRFFSRHETLSFSSAIALLLVGVGWLIVHNLWLLWVWGGISLVLLIILIIGGIRNPGS